MGSAFAPLSDLQQGGLWALCFGTMGAACVRNALRCGRVHCYFTGPLFLAVALAALLHGSALLPLGATGWAWLGAIAFVGGLGLTLLPEQLWGRYARRG